MGCKKRSGDFLSSDGHSRTSWFIWTPEEAVPSAILQISHGMCEYIERYESEGFIDAMTSEGFVVCGNDHIGHGRCAQENGDLGYFTDFSNLVDDLHTLNGIVRQTYRSLPYILLGHSMGSFVAREYIVKYDDINGGHARIYACAAARRKAYQPQTCGNVLRRLQRCLCRGA